MHILLCLLIPINDVIFIHSVYVNYDVYLMPNNYWRVKTDSFLANFTTTNGERKCTNNDSKLYA